MVSLRPPPPPPPPQKPMPMMDLQITVVSAKHLKNVNWRNGDLKPYAVAYVDPDRRSATRPDESTKPVWNERLLLPLPSFLSNGLDGGGDDIVFTLDVFHSKPSETPKALVGTARLPLRDLLIDFSCPSSAGPAQIRTLDLRRPSGRPHGKVRIKIALRERPTTPPLPPPPPSLPQEQQSYHVVAPPSHYHSAAPTPPVLPPRDYRTFYQSPLPPPLQYPYPVSYADPYSYAGGYGGYYSAPPPAARPPMYYDRTPTYYGGPSATVDHPSSYEQKAKGGRMGMGAGLAIGSALGGLAFARRRDLAAMADLPHLGF